MSKKRQFYILSGIIFILLFYLNTKVANPDSQPFYNFKRLYEKAQLSMASDPSKKADLLSSHLDKRLDELQNVVINGKSDYVLNTSLRYSTTAGQLTEFINEEGLLDKVPSAKKQLELHREVVVQLIDNYPKDDGQQKFVIDDRNYLTNYLEQLSSK